MRLPNGYGSVYKLKRKLRKPYVVVVTKGFVLEDGKAKQKRTVLGYCATKEEGLNMLAQYNKNPYNTDFPTFGEVYKEWSDEKYPTIDEGTAANYINAWRYLSKIDGKKIKDVKTRDLENLFNTSDCSDGVKKMMKIVVNQMYKYALRFEYVDKNYAQIMKPPKQPEVKIQRQPFSDDEIKTLWEHSDDETVKTILVDIYSGFRPDEILNVEIDRKNMVFIGGSKTESGRNRVVPIHSSIQGILDFQRGIDYQSYYWRFKKRMRDFGMVHRPHDCRVTFATKGDEYGVNEYVLKLLLGHKIDDLTHRVYIKKTVDDLRKEIEKIK